MTLAKCSSVDVYPFDVTAYLKEGYQIAQTINCPDELFAVMACAGPSIQRRGGVPAKGLVSHRVPWGPGGLCLTLLSVPQHQEEGACQGLLGASQSHTSPSTTEAHLSSRTPCLRNALASQLLKTDLMMWNTFSISLLLAWTENVCVNFLHIVASEVWV